MTPTTTEIRLRAADILAESPDAWCQGVYRRERVGGGFSHCLIGACREAAGYYAAPNDANLLASVCALKAVARDNCMRGHADWNDHPSRTREEVIAALRNVPR
jgi:hypothetical protein